MVQVVKQLPGNYEAMSLNPNTTNRKEGMNTMYILSFMHVYGIQYITSYSWEKIIMLMIMHTNISGITDNLSDKYTI